MAKNIYDLFNERKYGVDMLVEGYEFDIDNSIEFEDLDAAREALEDITLESTNEMIELRAAWYLEDLVIENMMYDDFDEEKIAHVMEAAKEEKKEGLGQKIKKLWERIKQWFASAFRAIANHFQSGENLVIKYRKEIPDAMRQSKAKIKMRHPRGYAGSTAAVAGKVTKLQAVGQSKQTVLDSIGVHDIKGVGDMVENLYFADKEAKEYEIKKLQPSEIMDWAGNKKTYMDALKKNQKETDGKFKEILAEIKKGGEGKEGDAATKAAEDAANFQFAIQVLNKMLSEEISCVKNISKACTAIIKKALGGSYEVGKVNDAGSTHEDERRQKEYGQARKAGFSRKDSAAMARGKLGGDDGKTDAEKEYEANKAYGAQTERQGPRKESWEIIDEEDYDNIEW